VYHDTLKLYQYQDTFEKMYQYQYHDTFKMYHSQHWKRCLATLSNISATTPLLFVCDH